MSNEKDSVDLTKWAKESAALEGPLAKTHEEFMRLATAFQKPIVLYKMVEQLRAPIPRDEFFRSPKYQHVKEGWHAAIFGIGYFTFVNEPVSVRICGTEPFPDFQLAHRDRVHDFEVTLVVVDKLSNRYEGDGALGAPYIAHPEQVPTFDVEGLRSAVASKVAKRYSSKVNLLVILDAGGHLSLDSITAAVKDGGGAAFSSVWVMGLEWLACVHTIGEMIAPRGWHKTGITPAMA